MKRRSLLGCLVRYGGHEYFVGETVKVVCGKHREVSVRLRLPGPYLTAVVFVPAGDVEVMKDFLGK